MKKCSACGQEKALDEFYKYAMRGKTYYESRCKLCRCRVRKEQYPGQKARIVRNATKRLYAVRAWLAKLKMLSGCVDCGYKEHPAALHFDHIRGKKDFNVGGFGARYSFDRLVKELKKCEVRCANCHAVATETRRVGTKHYGIS